MGWYAMLPREVLTLGFDRSCRSKVSHYRRMEAMRNAMQVFDNVA
jgi:hypothetical protein